MTPQTLDRPLEPRVATAVAPELERLTNLSPGPHPVVSCYVRLEPWDRTADRYLLTWKEKAGALEADPRVAALAREERLALERDLARIGGYLQHLRRLPHARGLALFACEALDLFLVVPLPRVHRTRVVLDDSPRIAELVAALQESRPIIVAALDRAVARFFTVSPAGAEELPGAFTASGRGGRYHGDRKDAPGKGERSYHGRVAEERHRHYAAVVERLEELAREHPASGLVLAGPADHTAALARFLPEPLAARVLGSCRLNPTSITTSALQAATHALAERHERAAVTVDLIALQESVGTGWAVEGARETFRALARDQIRTLYVREGLEGAGYRCATSGRLALAQAECGAEGEPRPVRDVADEAIEDALRKGARVVVVPPDVPAPPVDGLAATLRFR